MKRGASMREIPPYGELNVNASIARLFDFSGRMPVLIELNTEKKATTRGRLSHTVLDP